MTDGLAQPSPQLKRRVVAAGLVRALATTVVLVAVYYVGPLGALSGLPIAVTFATALLVLASTTAWQVRAVLVSPNPAIRAIEGVAATAPLFILLFAAAYYVMAQTYPAHFNVQGLTRTDTLYFAVTVFSTVGFGDITATSQTSRAIVTLQMVLDLIVLGLGVRVFIGAARLGRQRRDTHTRSAEPET
jgi:voltage-gated potassium channel